MLDRIDETILRIIEKDARISFNALAERISLSKTPSWARVQSLERRKFISAYRAELNPQALGLDVHAFVQVRTVAALQKEFEAAVRKTGSILECYSISGEADYLLHVLVSGISHLDEVIRQDISPMPGVKGTLTMIAMQTVKPRGYVMDCVRPPARSA